MNVRILRDALRLACAAALGAAPIANAGLFRAYLSFNGLDTNPCTVQQPCRLLPAALTAVNDGGEIWMLDSANYNTAPVTIAKGVKIFAIPGALGSIVGSGGDALIINTVNDVTLRNVQILNFNAGANGINIQSAGAVHIEKTSIDGFTSASTACINLNSTATVRVWVDDSFLRHCNYGIFANGTNVTNRSSVIVDNTRIERGFSATPPGAGIWMQGAIDVVLRNSAISRQDQGIHFENPAAGASSHLTLDRSQITRSTTALLYTNNVASAQGQISIKNSQLTTNGDQLNVTNSAVGGNVQVSIADSEIAYTGGNGVTAVNSAADTSTRVFVEMVRSQVKNTTGTEASLSATNGAKIFLYAHDSEFAHAGTAIQTAGSGAGGIAVSLIRSTISNVTTAIDHGFGEVLLDGSSVVLNANDFVNDGSGNIVSLGNNMVFGNTNGSGFTYITPTIIAPK